MGKFLIASEIGDGEYTGAPVYYFDHIAQQIIVLGKEIDEIDVQLTALEVEIVAAEAELAQANAALTAAIAAYQADPSIGQSGMSAAGAVLNEKRIVLDTLSAQKYGLEADQASKRSIKERWEALRDTPQPQRNVWCASWTLELTGEVDSIEINGIAIGPDNSPMLIYPTGTGGIPGQLIDHETQSGLGFLFNHYVQAGWQKWLPTYRIGTVTDVDYALDTADVTLDEVKNSHLDVNQSNTLSDVPVVYDPCNAAILDIDDRVVIEFLDQNWRTPQVIGFEKEPKQCIWEPWDQGPVDTEFCKNHIWQKRLFARDDSGFLTVNELCKAGHIIEKFPTAKIEINGASQLYIFHPDASEYSNGRLDSALIWDVENQTDPKIIPVAGNYIRIKTEVLQFGVGTFSDIYQLDLYSWDGGTGYDYNYFVFATFGGGETDPQFIGDNGGEEIELYLPDYLPAGHTIYWVEAFCKSKFGAEITMDYINFDILT